MELQMVVSLWGAERCAQTEEPAPRCVRQAEMHRSWRGPANNKSGQPMTSQTKKYTADVFASTALAGALAACGDGKATTAPAETGDQSAVKAQVLPSVAQRGSHSAVQPACPPEL